MGAELGSKLEFILALIRQLGKSPMASCPTITIRKIPIGMMKMTKPQSRLSRLGMFIFLSHFLSLTSEA